MGTPSRKQPAEQISEAETALGKLGSATAIDIAERGWETVL